MPELHEQFSSTDNDREKLLSSLPEELQDKWENATISQIQEMIKARKDSGFEKVVGYHISDIDFPIGSFIKPDKEGNVFYSVDLNNLYGKHSEGWIYVVEGTSNDFMIDKYLGWRTTKGRIKIKDKIKITPENMKKLGASFAKCEYH